jgi:tetratricopeptide (TPR) repeat protein
MKSCSWARLAVTALAFFSLHTADLRGQDLIGNLYNQGIALFQKKDYSGAVDYLGQVCDSNARHTQARYYLVQALLATRDRNGAWKHVQILCSQDPNNPQYQALKTQIQQVVAPVRKPVETTSAEPNPSIKLPSYELPRLATITQPKTGPGKPLVSPDRPKTPSIPVDTPAGETMPAGLEAAVQVFETGNYASAAQLLDALIATDKKNLQALQYRGMVDLEQGRLPQARSFFEQALKAKADFFPAQMMLGEAFMREGKYPEAEKAFQKASSLRDEAMPLLKLGELAMLTGKTDEAIAIYEKILKKEPEMREPKIHLALAALQKGDTDQANEMVNQVLKSDPDNAFARYVRGQILFTGELHEDAILSVKHAINLAPDNLEYRLFLAKIYMKLNRTPEALDLAGKIVEKSPQSWDARMILAEGLFAAGDYLNAQDHLVEAEGIQKSPETTLLNAKIARQTGDNEKASQGYQAYLSQIQTDPAPFMEFAQILEELGEDSSAGDIYEQVMAKFPGTDQAMNAENRLIVVKNKIAANQPPAGAYSPQPSLPPPPGQTPAGPRVQY